MIVPCRFDAQIQHFQSSERRGAVCWSGLNLHADPTSAASSETLDTSSVSRDGTRTEHWLQVSVDENGAFQKQMPKHGQSSTIPVNFICNDT